MAGFDVAAARQALAIPENYAIGAVIALGYQGEPAALANEQMLAQEIAPRQRKPLAPSRPQPHPATEPPATIKVDAGGDSL
jgi:hypothetical protein